MTSHLVGETQIYSLCAVNDTLYSSRKSPKIDSLRCMAACVVSYLDIDGMRHTVEGEADSLYEAAVLAVRTFRQHDCAPSELTNLEVEIRSSVTHTINLRRINQWLNGGARSPKEAVTKERLRALL